jgi:hypothetical protein
MDGKLQLTCDALSLCAVLASLAGWLPAIATFFAIIWYGIEIYESRTFRNFFRKPKE